MKILCIGKIVTFRGDFFEKNLLLQSDVVFDFESNGSNFSSLAPPGVDKKIIFNFFAQKDVMTPYQPSSSDYETPCGQKFLKILLSA